MRCALVLFSNAALEGFSGLQVSRAPGSTVVSSHSSPADLAANHPLRSSRWSVDVGIANAISKPGLSQASSAGQSRLHNKIIAEQRNSIIIALHNKIIKARQYHTGQRR